MVSEVRNERAEAGRLRQTRVHKLLQEHYIRSVIVKPVS